MIENEWVVMIHKRVQKIYMNFPKPVREQVTVLLYEIRFKGPIRGDWKNYSKLGKNEHHCHIKSGHPTYVCCWRAATLRTVEIYYVGTHENAPY